MIDIAFEHKAIRPATTGEATARRIATLQRELDETQRAITAEKHLSGNTHENRRRTLEREELNARRVEIIDEIALLRATLQST